MMGFACIFIVFGDRMGEMLHLHVFLIPWTSFESLFISVWVHVCVCAFWWMCLACTQRPEEGLRCPLPSVSSCLSEALFLDPGLFLPSLEASKSQLSCLPLPPSEGLKAFLGNVWLIIWVLGSELWSS